MEILAKLKVKFLVLSSVWWFVNWIKYIRCAKKNRIKTSAMFTLEHFTVVSKFTNLGKIWEGKHQLILQLVPPKTRF